MNLVNKKTILLLLLLASYRSWGQTQCKPSILPFIGGEELIYDVDYLMGKFDEFWLDGIGFEQNDETYNSLRFGLGLRYNF